jgi:hypothetical protein
MYDDPGYLVRNKEKVRTNAPISRALHSMLKIVRQVYPSSSLDPYWTEIRNKYTLKHDLYNKISGFDLFFAFHHFRRALGIIDMNIIHNMFGPHLTVEDLSKAFKTWSQLIPLQEPNRRHITHLEWLRKRPEFDSSLPRADPRMANPSVIHYKDHTSPDNHNGSRGIHPGKGQKQVEQNDFTKGQFKKFRYLALGLGEEASGWYYMLHPTIYEYSREVFKMCPNQVRRQVTHDGKDWATIIALLNKLMMSTHRDDGDIKDGLAGILQFGDARGSFLGFQHWRLLSEVKPGCGQLFNFSRLWHFNAEEEGFYHDGLVYAIGNGPRGYARDKVRRTSLSEAPDLDEDERKLAAEMLERMENGQRVARRRQRTLRR